MRDEAEGRAMAELEQTMRLRTAIQAIRAHARLESWQAHRGADVRGVHEAECMLEAADLLEAVLVRRRGEKESVSHALEPVDVVPDEGAVRLVG